MAGANGLSSKGGTKSAASSVKLPAAHAASAEKSSASVAAAASSGPTWSQRALAATDREFHKQGALQTAALHAGDTMGKWKHGGLRARAERINEKLLRRERDREAMRAWQAKKSAAKSATA